MPFAAALALPHKLLGLPRPRVDHRAHLQRDGAGGTGEFSGQWETAFWSEGRPRTVACSGRRSTPPASKNAPSPTCRRSRSGCSRAATRTATRRAWRGGPRPAERLPRGGRRVRRHVRRLLLCISGLLMGDGHAVSDKGTGTTRRCCRRSTPTPRSIVEIQDEEGPDGVFAELRGYEDHRRRQRDAHRRLLRRAHRRAAPHAEPAPRRRDGARRLRRRAGHAAGDRHRQPPRSGAVLFSPHLEAHEGSAASPSPALSAPPTTNCARSSRRTCADELCDL